MYLAVTVKKWPDIKHGEILFVVLILCIIKKYVDQKNFADGASNDRISHGTLTSE